MDFDRGEYVANLPKGEESVTEMIEELRAKVEQVSLSCNVCRFVRADWQARLLSYRLALAEKQMDQRLDLARQRNAQVGFVKEILASSNRKSTRSMQLY
jgi:kinetochore protein Mis12/MTW1